MRDTEGIVLNVLDDFDSRTETFAEYDVVSALSRIVRGEVTTQSLPEEYSWELMAFEFRENHPDKANEWGTYYGPAEDGTYFEYPSIGRISPEIIGYWIGRVNEATHPILKARYADLVWDFSRIVTKEPADVSMAHTAIDSRLEIAQRDLHSHKTDVIDHLRRALFLSISLNDSARICESRGSVIAFEDKVAEDDKAGLWGFSYDLLVGNRNILLSEDLEEKIVRDLEDRLNRLTQRSDEMSLTSHRWKAQRAVSRLTTYYHKQGQAEEVKRVILKYYEGFKHLVDSEASLIVSGWLQEVYSTYRQYGFSEEAEAITSTLRCCGPHS